ncbi:hypothetical protein [Shewanella sp.]|uniref:hypothetical protein n=1 Tax=Shewanella sp. TaxID=50422 RepID=UPI001ECD5FF2|nr:hypothetical protein [Shewanella sp.]NRB23572.1 hypothetical protein [Shewanella sp.]
MKKFISVGIALSLSVCFSPASFAETWTHSLGNCITQANRSTIVESDKLRNMITVKDDLYKGASFTCLLDLRSDKAITKVQIDFDTDSAIAVRDKPVDHPDIPSHLPHCELTLNYSPGGRIDYFKLIPTRTTLLYGDYRHLTLENPRVQHAGTGHLRAGYLNCSTTWFGNETRFYGLRISYED